MSLPVPEDDIHYSPQTGAGGMADDETDEEGLGFLIERQSTYANDNQLCQPGGEDGEHAPSNLDNRCHRKAYGVNEPPGEMQPHEHDEGSERGAGPQAYEAIGVRADGVAHLGDDLVERYYCPTPEDPATKVESAIAVGQIDGEKDGADHAQCHGEDDGEGK